MSATEPTWNPLNLINSDRMLLIVLSVLLLSHAGIFYVSSRFDLPFAFVAIWWVISFVHGFHLPESISSAIIENFFMLVVGEAYAFILAIRFLELGTWKSPSLLSCIALLVTYHFGGSDQLDYAFDQIRFQMNRPVYLMLARRNEAWPDAAVFRWGGTGFLDASVQYFLVLDRAALLARGEVHPESLVERSEHMKCNGVVRRLSTDFYSVTVWCALGDEAWDNSPK